ncbi:tRNA-dihydrouridine synthase [Alkalispirochaeta sphaeroplastigenens]|uniref:tRNA-dihydrouridine(20/20a) synthase n=1 Tax=Alkalispirochaeta sphaeroplastigenens TaxID=1187066 RepID=A0A2S4JX93_9SPIO|nr:tRNA dihydrouridine(20/20a) synthase DusA [Alkalispirochaeta sphaeroplastigenens]POR04120.1 tRNA-dihydrouridine synthase [Alkalispirochaeta sphaeroplastigenens]
MIPVSVAPMLDWTTRHYRYFARRLTLRTLLYTEMVTSAAVIHGDREALLAFHPDEHPLSLQLAGDDPGELARAVELAEPFGYDEYNLNVGCPSERVQKGNFGACLMADPPLVARLVQAMRSVTEKPVTVKHRIGLEESPRYEDMLSFVDTLAEAGVQRFTVHARIAILRGLSPKQNRSVPPLRYSDVYRLKHDRPHLEIELNGQVRSLQEIQDHLQHLDAVMIGRAAFATPAVLAQLDGAIFGDRRLQDRGLTRAGVVEEMVPYLENLCSRGGSARWVFTPLLGLFAGCPGARGWKRGLSGALPDLPPEKILRNALAAVPEDIQKEPLA